MKLKRSWIVALALGLVLALLPFQPAYADTITVDTTSDVLDAAVDCDDVTIASLPGLDGETSLREAICAANNNDGQDTIKFEIAIIGNFCGFLSGVCRIRPTSPEPALTDDDGTTIDGYTQPGALCATGSTSATLKIEIDGYNAGTGADGVTITSANNVVKGLAIRRFSRSGVGIYGSGNTVSGNYIGTDANGTADLGNSGSGVYIYNGAQNNTIGGTTAEERNVISGNWYGILISGSGTTGNTVSGNYIGTDAGGTTDLGNDNAGVHISNGAQNNVVGGDTTDKWNVISGNDGPGVVIFDSDTTDNTVSGNYIGTDANGTADLGNDWGGVFIWGDAQNNTVGPNNVIAHNGGDGVEVNGSSTISDTITQNSIFANGIGIDLVDGANWGIAPPVIFANTRGSVNVLGTACPNCTVELFENSDTDGEGETYVGDATADASGTFTVTVSSLSKPYLTATATDAVSGTSEFSAVFATTEIYTVTITADENDSSCGDGDCSLRDAIILANDNAGPDTIEFDIPWSGNHCSWSNGVCTIQPTSPLPVLTDNGTTINGYTQLNAAEVTDTMPAAVKIVINGTNAGTEADGLTVTSANNVVKGLVICSFSRYGVDISGSGATSNTISGNYIGTDATGGVNGNGWAGVCIDNGARNNTIGGTTAAERNVISFNDDDGARISGSGTMGNTISGNYIGTNAEGTAAWRNGGDGVYINDGAQNNIVGGDTTGERNIISGNDNNGVIIFGSDSNTISGNYIGTDVSGTADLGNEGDGVDIVSGRNNLIGGGTDSERNIISGNDGNGVRIEGRGNTVSGNYIGIDASGTADLGNASDGVCIWGDARNNDIGGDAAEERNVISGNGDNGVEIRGSDTMSNIVSGNYIGTDASGTVDLGNGSDGVEIHGGAQNNTVGGATDGQRNVISGNTSCGVALRGSDTMSNTVSGNYIGTDASGTTDLGNTYGVSIRRAQYNTVGGATARERNVISGNDSTGVSIYDGDATGNTFSGNYIGTDASGTANLGNTFPGVYIGTGAQNNAIGPGNLIAHNGNDGVWVSGSSATGNTITQNSIFSNTLGIDLTNGANGGIAAPVIVTTTLGSVNVVGSACPGCTVELFENGDTDGEGETYAGNAIADPGGAFTVTVGFLSDSYLTATATDPVSGTSEFSAVFTAQLPGPIYLPIVLKNAS